MRGGDPARFFSVRLGQGLPDGRGGRRARASVGRVATKGLDDETKGTWYAVVETPRGRAYHVRLSERQAETVRTGELVTFRTRREAAVRPVDRHFAEVASEDGGVYALGGGRRARRPVGRGGAPSRARTRRPGRPPRPGAVDHAGRLGRAARAAREAPRRGAASLPAPRAAGPLVARRPGRPPGARLGLDSVDPQALGRAGLGAEVAGALERRRELLRGLGITPGDPQREAKLSDLPRLASGQDFARETGEAFLETLPPGFRGQVWVVSEYVAVSDGRRFVLLPSTPEARTHAGQVVEVSRDGAGRVRFTEDPAHRAERERRALGEALARRFGKSFVETLPRGFCGKVQRGPEGAPYLVVSDSDSGSRRCFVPATPETRALVGKVVEVAGDDRGRFVSLQPRGRGLGR